MQEHTADLPFWQEEDTLEQIRSKQETLGRQAARREGTLTEQAGRWYLPPEPKGEAALLYFHGGGYVSGGPAYAHHMAGLLAHRLGRRVCRLDYRLAPEHPYPAAMEDGAAAYEGLLAEGISPETLFFIGDSSGGGLLLALALRLRDRGRPLPRGLIALSPWTDLSGNSAEVGSDWLLPPALTKRFAHWYAGEADRRDPGISPLWGDLKGLPPTLLFAGGTEPLLVDAERFHQKLLASGGDSRLVVTPGRGHCYTLTALREAQRDFITMDLFMDECLKQRREPIC